MYVFDARNYSTSTTLENENKVNVYILHNGIATWAASLYWTLLR